MFLVPIKKPVLQTVVVIGDKGLRALSLGIVPEPCRRRIDGGYVEIAFEGGILRPERPREFRI